MKFNGEIVSQELIEALSSIYSGYYDETVAAIDSGVEDFKLLLGTIARLNSFSEYGQITITREGYIRFYTEVPDRYIQITHLEIKTTVKKILEAVPSRKISKVYIPAIKNFSSFISKYKMAAFKGCIIKEDDVLIGLEYYCENCKINHTATIDNYDISLDCQNTIEEIREKYGELLKGFTIVDMLTIICPNNHQLDISVWAFSRNPICYCCQFKDKFELFKLLDTLECNYKIVQERTGSRRGLLMGALSMSTVYTYNELGHLTGKIVFDDTKGYKQLKAKKNNLVFRWMEKNLINDIAYCKWFLSDFFKEINNKHKQK